MLQRIQTIFMFLVTIVSGLLANVFMLWKATYDESFIAYESILQESLTLKPIGVIFIISAILSFVTIFYFKNRQLQFVLNRINIILNFLLVAFIVYHVLNLSGETLVSEKGIGSFLPILSIFLLVFANKFIKKDENLVKSADRLR